MTRFETNKRSAGLARLFSFAATLVLLLAPAAARAGIDGVPVTGPVTLTASAGYISVPDGASIYSWGYSCSEPEEHCTGSMQLPGPTLIVTEGATRDEMLKSLRPLSGAK